MKFQHSCKDVKFCPICDEEIYTSYDRWVYKGVHYHPECKPRVKKVEFSFIGWLLGKLK